MNRQPILLLMACSLVVMLAGCASTKTTVSSPDSLEKYRKVYLAPAAEDRRAVRPKVLDKLQQCGFKVVDVKEDGPPIEAQGTGFVITPDGKLLTCAHLMEGQSNATAWINGQRFEGKVISINTNLDIALVQLKGDKDFPVVPLGTRTNYSMGQEVYTIGFPLVEVLGIAPRLNKGLISSTVGMEDSPDHLQISAEVQPGNSGGPLLSPEGEVIGMVVSTLNPLKIMLTSGGSLPQNVNFAVKLQMLDDFLKGANISLPATTSEKRNFETAKDALALIRAGDVQEKDLKIPSLFCVVQYLSFWDLWFRFRAFEVAFYDMKTGKTVLKAGQYGDNVMTSENSVIEKTFYEIHGKFFPGQANPFSNKKEKPVPEPK